MKVECFSKVNDASPKETYEADSVEARIITPFHHEVILTKDGKSRLIEVHGGERQGTSPERYAGVKVIRDDGTVQSVHAIDGRANDGEEPADEQQENLKYEEVDSQRMTPEEIAAWVDSLKYEEVAAELMRHGITPKLKFPDRQAQLRKALLP